MSDLPVAQAKGKRTYKRHLGNYLLDKRLQLRYVAFVTILSALISGTLGFLIWKQENRATEAVVDDAAMNMAAADSAKSKEEWSEIKEFIRSELHSDDNSLILTMVGVGVGLVLVLSAFLVIMTHKVAGPLYKVAGYFDKMRDGHLGDVWPLRKWDMLKHFYGVFKETHDALRERAQHDNEAVGRFLEACSAAGIGRDGEVGHALDELESYKKSRDEALA